MDYLKTLRDLFAFMKNTRLSETQMRELQNQKLRALLHFVWERSAFTGTPLKRQASQKNSWTGCPYPRSHYRQNHFDGAF